MHSFGSESGQLHPEADLRAQFCYQHRCQNRQTANSNREEAGRHRELFGRNLESASKQQRKHGTESDEVYCDDTWNQSKVDKPDQRMLGIQGAENFTLPLPNDGQEEITHRSHPGGSKDADFSLLKRVVATSSKQLQHYSR